MAAMTACAPVTSPTQSADDQAEPTAQKIELRVTHWWGTQFEDWGVFPTYREAHPAVTLVDEQAPYSAYHEKLLTQFAAGVAPDVVLVNTYFNYAMLTRNVFAPLNDALEVQGINLDTDFTTDPRLVNGLDGQILGLDLYLSSCTGLYINKELADEVGASLPVWGTPEWDTWTWDDLVPWLQAGTKTLADGTVEQYGLDGVHEGLGFPLATHLASARGYLFDLDAWWNYGEQETTINSAECVDAIQRLIDLVHLYNVAPSLEEKKTLSAESPIYLSGRAMASWTSTGAFRYRDTPFEQLLIAMPFVEQRTMQQGANYFSANAASAQLELATELVVFAVTNDQSNQLFTDLSSPSNYRTRFYQDRMEDSFYKMANEVCISRHEKASLVPELAATVVDYPSWWGREPQFVSDTVTAAIESAMLQEKSVQQALDEAKAAIDARLQEA
jgi:ABC-type glycerol-3-phosphate transport system substrate-binding protein